MTPAPRARVRRETSAGGVVVRRASGGPLVLLIRDGHRNWGFPKGHIEAGEEPAAAAMREIREETGIDHLSMVGTLATIAWTFRFRGAQVHKTCHFFAFETDQIRTKPQRREGISACRWVTLDTGKRLLTHENAREVLAGITRIWDEDRPEAAPPSKGDVGARARP